MKHILTAALFALLATPAAAQEDAEPVTPASVVAEASAQEWVPIAPEDVLIMELAPTEDGKGRYVVIQLMPPPFSQAWVENVRSLARAEWWDGLSVYRSVDNWVVQWGDVTEKKALPEGVVSPEEPYFSAMIANAPGVVPKATPSFLRHPMGTDTYVWERGSTNDLMRSSGLVGFSDGWPVGLIARNARGVNEDLHTDVTGRKVADTWPIHCYGSVGVARDIENTGTGSELYAVIGHAPRQLDRNIAVVGRVIEGMEHLSTLPRGTGEAGVYESRDEDTPIVSIRLASDHPDGETFRYEYLDTASESFARYVHSRANRQDAFYTVPAGGVDICNVQVPVRLVEE